jgi:putative ABC transport system permease protein
MHIQLPWWLQDLCEGWRTSPARVFLTLFAVGTGTLTLTLLLAAMGGLRDQAARLTADFGANTAILELDTDNRPALTPGHLAILQAQFPETRWVGERYYGPLNVPPHGRLALYVASPAWNTVRGLPVLAGRPLDPADAGRRDAYALAASDVNLAPGDRLQILQTEFTVVGVTGPGRFLQIPDTLRGDWEHPDDSEIFHRIRLLHTETDPLPLFRQIEAFFAREAPNADFHLTTPDHLLTETRRLSRILQRVFGTVTLLSLLLGGATLGSLMIQNVRQRRREIGLRMAIGARGRDIFTLFMSEGLLLSTFAAFIGVFLATHLLHRLPADLEIPLKQDGFVLTLPFLLAWITGGVFSWIPARMAARLVPARALRCED